MNRLDPELVVCPYCGENVEVEVEALEEAQTYIEDCSVCCRPMQLETVPGDGGTKVTASRSD